MCKKLWASSKTAIVLYARKKSLRRRSRLGAVSVCEMPLSRGGCHSASPGRASSGCFLQALGWPASRKPVLRWGVCGERNRSFPAEWACCSALPVCVEFRWEGKKVFLLANGFLTTINLGVWAISIMFPPINVLSGKRSGHTVCKAEFTVTWEGGGKGTLSEAQIIFCDVKKTPNTSEHAEQNLIWRFMGSCSYQA